ncbi:MAG: acyl-CoA dehydratase activase-related protein [bacterium]
MRVGLPRGLLYYRYGTYWQSFLSGLGVEVVLSRPTDKVLLSAGLKCVSSEVCLPVKIVAGHILDLKDRVDAIFLPRMVSLEDHLYACPKMIGIVDIARMMMGGETRLIAPAIRRGMFWPHFRAGLELTGDPARVVRALVSARPLLDHSPVEPEFGPGERNVALIGHFYNIGDDYVGLPIVKAFERYGYRVRLKDELPLAVLRSREGFAQNIRWIFERELYNAFRFFVGRVDGVCAVVSMGCGPDSLVAELMREEAQRRAVPFLQLVVDEHTGTAGLVTRVEAFLELAERRRAA